MPIRSFIIRIRHLWCDRGPPPLWLRVADYEECKAHERYCGRVEHSREEEHKQEEGQSKGELEEEAQGLRGEALLLVLAGCCKRDKYIE